MAKIIVLEGMSGAGKDSQLKRLQQDLALAYLDLVPLVEPSSFLEGKIREYKTREQRDPYVEFHLFTADRRDQYQTKIAPRYAEQDLVFLQSRSIVSTLAYQGMMQGISFTEILDANKFFPELDLVLILLADPTVAYERIFKREAETGKARTKDETLEKLARIEEGYQVAARYVKNAVFIDANKSEEEVYREIKKAVRERLGLLRRGLFLDKDGTLVKNDNYPETIPSYELLDDAREGIRLSAELDAVRIIVSNQPWVRKGRLTVQQVNDIFKEFKKRFEGAGGKLDEMYYCSHVAEDHCQDKKPSDGMIQKGIKRFHLDRTESWIVGDSADDMRAGKKAGLKTVLTLSGNNRERKESDKELADVVRANFTEAMVYLKEVF